MNYTGENLLPGQIGNFLIVLSLFSSLIAAVAYFFAAQSKNELDHNAWKKLGRIAFVTEAISVFVIFSLIFYIINNHLFEYYYAWKHSSRSLEFKYLFACFWEGQEGSFLLWSTCQAILGLILIRTSKQFEAPVMSVVSFAQFGLTTMVAGLYIFGWKMGSNPFILLRDAGVLDNAPGMHLNFDVTQPIRPDYMQLPFMKDGNDLNPLLQNYWMVIHPPVLFMGFAATVVPFAYAIAGLWKNDHENWTKPALIWTSYAAAVLGVGIMMGGMWAYESLSFGGYWAWDPVENASLVPWMILVAGLHTLLIYRHTGHSLRSSYFFFIMAFVFILYSTFLTRSGILGETSVHAFTDLGMNWQLLTYLLIFTIPSLLFFGIKYKQIPSIKKEEELWTREFWMFIGALIFFLSAIVIIGKTSLPVFNKVFGTNVAPPEDPEYAYNSIQVYVAIIIALLTGFTQYLKYKNTERSYFWKKMLTPLVITIVLCVLYVIFGSINYHKKGPGFEGAIWLALFTSIYTIIANLSYIFLGVKGKLKVSGAYITHVGFGLILLGIIISASNKEIISINNNGIEAQLSNGENPRENLTLVQGLTAKMDKYELTYEKDSAHPKKQLWFYKVRFKRNDGKEEFVLEPNAFVDYKGNGMLMANPDSRNYWDHDVFTYITSVPNPNTKDTALFKPSTKSEGDTIFYSKGYITLENLKVQDQNLPEELFGKDGALYELPLVVHAKTGSSYKLTNKLVYAKGNWISIPDTVTAESMILQMQKITADKKIELGVKETDAVMKYVTLKAYKFPFIKVLWYGVWITAIGFLISMYKRIRKK
jgi:cytochrome c-type biogenesis protein CcmF